MGGGTRGMCPIFKTNTSSVSLQNEQLSSHQGAAHMTTCLGCFASRTCVSHNNTTMHAIQTHAQLCNAQVAHKQHARSMCVHAVMNSKVDGILLACILYVCSSRKAPTRFSQRHMRLYYPRNIDTTVRIS